VINNDKLITASTFHCFCSFA